VKERSVTHSTFVIERSYPTTPERVFAAFSDPVKKRRWFGEGGETELEEFEMDFRVGGCERTRCSSKQGFVFTNDSVYRDILPNRRIVIAYNISVGDKRISSSQATVELLPSANGTDLIFTDQGAYFEGADGPEIREDGWRILLERLAEELEH
jgi:uncharacterized protein YndB with AHSA1/START domain